MTRIVYVNGEYVPEGEARISIFDRGFLMADAVYEVTSVLDGKLIDFDGHIVRLDRSLGELAMRNPLSRDEWLAIHRELVTRNAITDGLIYLQVTRGNPGDRDFAYPPADTPPTVVLFTQSKPGLATTPDAENGIKIITVPDLRWARRDIKTVQLLYPSMAKMEAKARGASDAWLIEDGMITEGSSNNAWIVKDGVLVTRQLSQDILHGITRKAVKALAADMQIKLEERPFSLEEALAADEAFLTSASAFVMPVVEIDGNKIASGTPGPVAKRMREAYLDEMRKAAI